MLVLNIPSKNIEVITELLQVKETLKVYELTPISQEKQEEIRACKEEDREWNFLEYSIYYVSSGRILRLLHNEHYLNNPY